MDLYERIKTHARRKGYSISALEKECGLPRSYIYKTKKITPRPDKLKIIADALDVTIEELLGSDDIAYEETTHTWEPEPKKNENAMHVRDVFPIPEYYIYEQTRELTDFLMHHPEYSLLFDASRNVKPEDIEKAIKILDVLSK